MAKKFQKYQIPLWIDTEDVDTALAYITKKLGRGNRSDGLRRAILLAAETLKRRGDYAIDGPSASEKQYLAELTAEREDPND